MQARDDFVTIGCTMISSRMRRYETRRQQHRITLAIIGIFGLVAFLLVFGLRILIGLSVLVDRMRGASPTPQAQPTVILPPVLDALPQATFSATLSVSGKGSPNLTAILYVNDKDVQRMPTDKDGNFVFKNIAFAEGNNTVSAKLTDEKGSLSDLSEVLSVMVKTSKPSLEVTQPDDNAEVHGDAGTVTVTGKTDDNVSVHVNDRFVVVRSDNTFSYEYRLKEGTNTLAVVAEDQAGNSTTVTRTVTYKP